MNTDKVLDLDSLRERGARPRVHGNGFIQLDLTDRLRLHIWNDPDIPRQTTRSPIHDHVFSFTSHIIVGRMVNIIYEAFETFDGDYLVHEPEIRRGEDSILIPTKQQVQVFPKTTHLIEVGTSKRRYHMPAFEYHETLTDGPSATIIEKDGPTQAQGATIKPRVLVPSGQEPDNEFDRYDCATADQLWTIINRVLERRHD